MVIELYIDFDNNLFLTVNKGNHMARWVNEGFINKHQDDLFTGDIKKIERFINDYETRGHNYTEHGHVLNGFAAAQYLITSPQHLRRCFEAIKRVASIDKQDGSISLSKDDFIAIMNAEEQNMTASSSSTSSSSATREKVRQVVQNGDIRHSYAQQSFFHRNPVVIARDLLIPLSICGLPDVTISAILSGGALKQAILNALQQGINHCHDTEQLGMFRIGIEASEAWQTLQIEQGTGIRQLLWGTSSSLDAARDMFEEKARTLVTGHAYL